MAHLNLLLACLPAPFRECKHAVCVVCGLWAAAPGRSTFTMALAYAPEAMLKHQPGDEVLEAASMASMVGCIHQLGWLARYSHEIFTNLAHEAEQGSNRLDALKDRMRNVTDRLARVDDALGTANEDELANIAIAFAAQLSASRGDGVGFFT